MLDGSRPKSEGGGFAGAGAGTVRRPHIIVAWPSSIAATKNR
jgi:hypothetical protein